MKNMKDVFKLWRKIFSNWKYISIVFLFAISFYIFNAILNNLRNIWYSYKNEGFSNTFFFGINLVYNFWQTILLSSIVSIILIGILTGILISLMIYNFNLIRNNKFNLGIISGIGIFLGVFVPGCVACGIGLAGLLGLTASFASLPFQGKEISFLAIFIIFFSIVKTSYDISSPKICKINDHEMKGGIYNGRRKER